MKQIPDSDMSLVGGLKNQLDRLPFRLRQQYIVYVAFVVLFLVFAVTLRNVGAGFLHPGNLWNIVRQTSLIAIMSVGMAFVLGTADIDLSVGSLVGVVSLVTAMAVQRYGIAGGVVAGLGVGVLAGSLNGFLITVFRIPSFLATLGTMISFAGISRTMTNLRAVPITNSTYNFYFGGGTIGSVPVLFVWMIAIVGLGHFLLRRMPFGLKVLAVGDNPQAAFNTGIKVKRVRFLNMVWCAVLAASAGILWAGRFGGGRYSLGDGTELSVIAATVLGGTSIFGGKSTVVGAAAGAVLIGMLNNALILYGLDVYQQMIVRGMVIVLAVALTTLTEK